MNLKAEIIYNHGSVENAAEKIGITKQALYNILNKDVYNISQIDGLKLQKLLSDRKYKQFIADHTTSRKKYLMKLREGK